MTNLNKAYHKGKYRGGEWAKHLRPYLKRVGNKRFRKSMIGFNVEPLGKNKTSKGNSSKTIKARITLRIFGNKTKSYDKKYRTMRDLNNSINRPNVIRYLIIE
jgi:hypothetical protein